MVIFGLLVLERRKDAKERVCLSMFGCAEGKYAIAPNALPVAGELVLGHLFFDSLRSDDGVKMAPPTVTPAGKVQGR